MPSYQDIETRLAVVEDKLDFVMKVFTVQVQYRSIVAPDQVITETKSLLDKYREMKHAGGVVIDTPHAEVTDGTPNTNTNTSIAI